jgi:large subunit ribosomal protein L33
MAKNEVRPSITLVCSECKKENYVTVKNKKNTTDKLELKKYCSTCRKATVHKEKK